MNVKQTLTELLEILNIAAAPLFVDASDATKGALFNRLTMLENDTMESHLNHHAWAILKHSMIDGIRAALTDARDHAYFSHLQNTVKNAIETLSESKESTFLDLFPQKEGNFPFRAVLQEFDAWLRHGQENSSTVLQDNNFENDGQAILAKAEAAGMQFRGDMIAVGDLFEIMFNEHDFAVAQRERGNQIYTRMSIMDDRGETWASSTDLIIRVGSLEEAKEPAPSEAEQVYMRTLQHFVKQFVTLDGVPEELLAQVHEKMTQHYFSEYKNSNTDMELPKLTEFLEGISTLKTASTMSFQGIQPKILDMYFKSQITNTLDEIGTMSAAKTGEHALGEADHLAVVRMMQMVQIASSQAGAYVHGVTVSPSTKNLLLAMIKDLIVQQRAVLGSHEIKDPTVRNLSSDLIAVLDASIYASAYEGDEHSNRIKDTRYTKVLEACTQYLGEYFGLESVK